ncbi:uncharacterized protein LOC119454288 isoform X4 [Dermacentor silvarum]|uniref:uncharacterized protein LOC119454288 isoform X1 n=1 Tax=Dermacentor silvarum TaxID=543639 RepID=UPI002100705C|nr:uncharacterized protein LOC119454288 isoform X1 [Dermacentor silvarum]XP_049524277.1 uncharacterized protein LOC119454288 isoform X2 [Dermacentor silvarum]XP_049524278.1 uncharacterized protein LOC119454288 isoform X3 [Dermacentor silvarum]XP_049524279.1 uncharacterized protein LOC119454288 isoform X4 [Dermacentor silvarum]
MKGFSGLTIIILLGVCSGLCCGSSCANFTFPNFLDIGKCLKKSGDLCTAKTDGIAEFLSDLGRCVFQGLANFDLPSQVYLLSEYVKYLLARNDFSNGSSFLKDLCKFIEQVTGGLVKLCSSVKFSNKAVCGKPIDIRLVTSTPFAQCLKDTGLTCVQNKPVDEPALLGALRILACLVSYVFTTAPIAIVTQLACDFVTFFARIFGPTGYIVLRPFLCAFVKGLGITCPTIKC